MSAEEGGPLYQRMLELLEEEGLAYQRHDESRSVRVDHEGTDVQWSYVAQTWEDEHVFACYSVSPLRARPETLLATSEFVERANIGVLAGNFEIDLDDGEIRFKTTVGFGPSGTWSDELARVVVYTNLAAMDHYVVSLLEVVTGSSTAVEALAKVE